MQCPVASSEALDLLHQAMCAVTYQCIAMAISMDSKVGVFFLCCFVCCYPGGHRGNTEWVVAQWQSPEASGIALYMLLWAMHLVLHRRTTMGIKMAGRWGALFPNVDLCLNINVAEESSYGSIKLKKGYTNVHYYVYCYFLPYWLPPTAMDTILATIVAGRRAQLENTQSSIDIN